MNYSSKAGQVALCYGASHQATIQAMAKFISGMNTERSSIVSKWRENGKTSQQWEAVEELDKIIDSQERILLELERGDA
jgi:hypothetical protein